MYKHLILFISPIIEIIISSFIVVLLKHNWTDFSLLSWTAGLFSLTLLREQRVESLVLLPCWPLLTHCEMSPRRTSLTVPSSTLSFKGSVELIVVVIMIQYCIYRICIMYMYTYTANNICKVNLCPSFKSFVVCNRFSLRIILYLAPSIVPSTLTNFLLTAKEKLHCHV